MESDKCSDHAYATVINAKTVENTREILKNKVDEVRLNDLNDAADHDPLCLNDMNENGRDVNSTETASDEMETKLELKPSKEKEIVDERKDTNFDGKAGSESDSGTVLNIKSVFDEECADDNKLSSAEQVENNHCASNSSESSVKSIKEDNANSMATSEEDLKPSDSEKISDNDCEDSDNGEEVIEMESQIKSDAGNGIVMSLTRKRSAEAVKRKSDSSLKSPPSKYRKYLVVSTRRSPRISAVNGNSNKESEDTADEKISNKNVGTGIFKGDFEEDSEKDEKIRSSSEEKLTRRRSASHSDSAVAAETKSIIKSDLDKNVTSTPKVKTPPGRKHLFFKGKKASPAQTKPLSKEELAKYKAPFDHGWRRELVYRGTSDCATKTQADTYYFPPGKAPKLRSMVQISEWLLCHDTSLTPDNFTFMRRAIGVDGELVRNASQSRGRASMEAAIKKRNIKNVKDELIHDDNDGQFDKPEVVIERDSDDFIGQIMTVMNQEEKSKDDTKSDISGSKLVEFKKVKEEKMEILSTSTHGAVVTYAKKKALPKATARKSTTQKTFKKSLSQTGVENLCSLNCPGLQGVPPMLHCNVCMCLFHQECVNFFGSNGDFVCLRCKDMSPSDNNNEPTVLQASNPTMLKHLKSEATSSENPTVFRTFPNGDTVQESCVMKLLKSKCSSPIVITQVNSKGQTIPTTSVSPYKTIPFSPSPPVSASLSYPVLLTPDPSFIITSSAPAFPISIAASSSISSSKASVPDPVSARMSEYSEIRPLIKQEPVDFSYDESQKADKVKASSEALDNLKNVLSSRIGNSNLEKHKMDLNSDTSKVDVNTKHQANKLPAVVSKSFNNSTNNVPLYGNIFSQPSQFNALPQNMGQPRLSYGPVPPPQMQYGPNAGFRLVPVGAPIPLGGLQVPLPLVPSPSIVRMAISTTSTTTTNSKPHRPVNSEPKKIIPKASTIVVSSQDDVSPSGPLVVNAKAVTPLNGQMLTLPPPVVKKLTLNRPLALKINNKQITVPPSGFFHSEDGLKVFLPPNTFPTAEENISNVSVIDSRVSVEESSEKTSEATNEKSPDSKKDSIKSNEPTEKSADDKCVGKSDIRKNKFYNKCCLMQRLYGVYDCMVHIFKYLALQDLLKMGLVCKSWRKIVQLPDLWTDVHFMNSMINDWDKAVRYLCRRNVQSISLVGVTHFEDPNRTWHQLISSIHELSSLKKISLCHIPSTVLQTITTKLPHLESLCAEKITDFIDDTMWEVPSKLDVGIFCTLTGLRELKLCGPGGLTLPSFNFGCGLADLGKLSNLRTLHLTSLKNLKGSDFNFISSLHHVERLALGDCEQWTEETYLHLKQLTSLRFLCLECGWKMPDTGLREALSSLTLLESLELWKFAFTKPFVDQACYLKQLKHLCVFPVSALKVAPGIVNSNTLNAVKKITNLKTLKWVFQEDNSSTIILSDSENNDDDDQWIPFQSVGMTNENKEAPTEYISVKQLKEKFLEKALPNTQVNIYSSAHERGHS